METSRLTVMSGEVKSGKGGAFETTDPRRGMHIIHERNMSQKH